MKTRKQARVILAYKKEVQTKSFLREMINDFFASKKVGVL
jgi:hypothetical protein